MFFFPPVVDMELSRSLFVFLSLSPTINLLRHPFPFLCVTTAPGTAIVVGVGGGAVVGQVTKPVKGVEVLVSRRSNQGRGCFVKPIGG